VFRPFSLWHGWIVYFAVINLFQAFTGLHENGPTVLLRILVIIGLAFLTFTAISYVEYKKYRGDITGAAAIGIGLLAIFSNQHDPWIHWIALICGITTLLYATRPYLFGLVSAEENVPLIP
jgi:phosphatidylserine synthase